MTNRIIKFRFWRELPSKAMIYDNKDIAVNSIGEVRGIIRYSNKDAEYSLLNLIPMQFTGLKDKNGKEIYEGDIIRCDIYEREDYDDFNSQKPREVKWSDKCAGFYPFIKSSGWRSGVENVEVIGNIHENKNLIV